MAATQLIPVDDPSRNYGDRVVAVEPGGVEPIPLDERHGRPRDLFLTWFSPNMEFATIAVGILSVFFVGFSFGQAVAAIVIGTALGDLTFEVGFVISAVLYATLLRVSRPDRSPRVDGTATLAPR